MMRLPPTAFGIQPRSLLDEDLAAAEAGVVGMVAQLQSLFDAAKRDAAIAVASGRWRLGHPDPEVYVPGDVVALRGFAVAADLARIISYQRIIADPPVGREGDEEIWLNAVSHTLAFLADTNALYEAVPHFLDAEVAVGILASRPPEPDDVAELRLPYPRISVWFGRVLEVGPELHDWPESWDRVPDLSGRPTSGRTAIGDLRALGGGIEGVVLSEAPGGGLSEEVLWLVSVNPDPSRPGPAALDRYRATVWGRLSSARLAHVARNLAATVAWAEWHEPDRHLKLPDDPESREWRKAVRRGEFRRREPRGAAGAVRVLDVARAPVADGVIHDRPTSATHASPVTHLRRAHWRHQRVGAGLAERRLVRVPATVVNPGTAPLAPVVYRIPAPDDARATPAERAEPGDPLDLRRIDLPDPSVVDLREVEIGVSTSSPNASHQQTEVSLP